MNPLPIRTGGCPGSLASSMVALILALAGATPALAGGASFGYWTGDSDGSSGFQYALIERDSQTSCSVWNDDAWADIGRLQEEVESSGRELLWFTVGDESYVVRDPAVIRRAHDIVQPMAELGKQQGELGRQQGELGRRQGELGALQGRIGALQGRVSALQASRNTDAHSEVAELRRQLEELSTEAHELGQRQRALGQRQRELGERQAELGARQRQATKMAEAQLRTLAETSVRSGRAEEL